MWNQIQAPHAIDATLDSTQVSFRRLDVTRVNRALAECEIPVGFKLLRAGARIDLSFSQPRDRPWALDFSDHDYAMLKSFDEAGGYVAFEAARAEGAVLVGLMDRSGKLPEVLADIVAAFLDLPRGTRKKSPE